MPAVTKAMLLAGYGLRSLEGAAGQGCSSQPWPCAPGTPVLSQAETGHSSRHRCTAWFSLHSAVAKTSGNFFFSFPAPQVEAAAPPRCSSGLGRTRARNRLLEKKNNTFTARKTRGHQCSGLCFPALLSLTDVEG